MSQYLNYDEFVEYAPDNTGKVRVNHTSSDCGGGRDSMIVERKSDGSVSAYCFRCGKKGYKPDDSINPYKHRTVVEDKTPLVLPDDLKNIREFLSAAVPVKSKAYLHSMGLYNLPSLNQHINMPVTISYSETANRVYFIFDGRDAWLARSLDKDSPRKWVENIGDKYTHAYIKPNPSPRMSIKRRIMIVEDLPSALVASLQGYHAICLYGSVFTSRHIKLISDIVRDHDILTAFVFLDNDNTKIKMLQADIKSAITDTFDIPCFIVKSEHDPKLFFNRCAKLGIDPTMKLEEK